MKSDNTKIVKGFFKRFWNSITGARNENKREIQERYMENWDKIKWRYRVGKFVLIFGVYSVGKSLLFDKYINSESIQAESDKIKKNFSEYLHLQWGVYTDINFGEYYNRKFQWLSKFLKIYVEKELNESLINENKEYDLLYKIAKVLAQTLMTEKMQLNEYFSNLDLQPNFVKNLMQKVTFVQIKKNYNEMELGDEFENMINVVQNNYKKILCSAIPTKNLQISTNLIDDFASLEEVAFIISFNLIELFGNIKLYKKVEDDFINYFNSILNTNRKYFNGKYKEDLKNIVMDIKTNGDVQSYLIFNPFLSLNFEDETKEFLDILNERQLEVNLKKISLVLELLHNAGFDLEKVKDFDFGKIDYKILDLVDKDSLMKNKMERYMKKKTGEILKYSKNQIDSVDSKIISQWSAIKNSPQIKL